MHIYHFSYHCLLKGLTTQSWTKEQLLARALLSCPCDHQNMLQISR
uniref:Uncharacterized protein n=1 Tax=Rhizophora mucronata TaxID=61149 RepID=A0A2P2P676_RHIMU